MADQDNVSRAITNYTRILVMVTEIVAATAAGQNPTQAQVDAVVSAAGTAGVMGPKPDASVDGESYQWGAYQEMIGRQLEQLMKVRAMLAGPFEIRSGAI